MGSPCFSICFCMRACCRLWSNKLLKRMCLFRHWLTTTSVNEVLTPNYPAYLLFVLRAKHRYLCWAKQLFRKIDADSTIAACCWAFLASAAVRKNYGLRGYNKKNPTRIHSHKHPLSHAYLIKFTFSENDRRCRFLGCCALTAHLSDNLRESLHLSLWTGC